MIETKIKNMLSEDIALMTCKEYIKLSIYKEEGAYIIETMNTNPNYELHYEIGEHYLIEKGYDAVMHDLKVLYYNGCYVGSLFE